ncbi:MAG: AAA family ATPase [Alphaproteobacteria bacterium]|nr:AAA family ATPase [Alphaproteobacteria bacterium]
MPEHQQSEPIDASLQQEVIDFLRDPASYEDKKSAVEVIETHASLVFLVGDRSYKLKRAVKYSYLDFSTLEQRQVACAAELRLNRRTAPQLYLDVRPISRRPDGRLAWGRVGEVLDVVVVMQRFAADAVLDRVADRGGLTPAITYALAAHIAEFHRMAEPCSEGGGSAAMRELAQTNLAIAAGISGAGFGAARAAQVEAALSRSLNGIASLLDERRAAGKVRRGHGDLHLRNICLINGKPTLFDAIEFSEAIACIDVLYDLAFLLMDLEHRGARSIANRVFNRYLDLTDDDAGIVAMPAFIALRAIIRAHVTATMAEHGWGGSDKVAALAEARGYLGDAATALQPAPVRLIAVGGVSGTGKSTLAAALAAELGVRPGARHLRSDVLRKLMLGTEPESPLPAEAYTPEVTARVYRALGQRARTALSAGYPAVIDAVSLRVDEREAFLAIARDAGVPFTGLWLEASPEALAARLRARSADASDASPEILAQQLKLDPGPLDWTRIDAGASGDATLAAARLALR